MYGRVRASPSPSPLDCLEIPPSKIIKDDSLSIYESTLMKLKLGSQRHVIISPPEETDCTSGTVPETTSDLSSVVATKVEASCRSGTVSRSCQDLSSDGEAMMVDTDGCCSARVSNASNDSQTQSTTSDLNSQQKSEGVSILYMFSKFKGNHDQCTPTISPESEMTVNNGSASFSSCSGCQSSSSSAKEKGSSSSSFASVVSMEA